jgi:hypothetical protein
VINDAKGRTGRDVAAVEEPIYVKDGAYEAQSLRVLGK